jgi:hypothetical protein
VEGHRRTGHAAAEHQHVDPPHAGEVTRRAAVGGPRPGGCYNAAAPPAERDGSLRGPLAGRALPMSRPLPTDRRPAAGAAR